MGNQTHLEKCNEDLNNLIKIIEEHGNKEKEYINDEKNCDRINKEFSQKLQNYIDQLERERNQSKDKDKKIYDLYKIIIIISIAALIIGLIWFIYDYIKTKRLLKNIQELQKKKIEDDENQELKQL